MERDSIYVRGTGIINAEINDLEGTALDPNGIRYVRILEGENVSRWLPETDFMDLLETPIPFELPHKSNGFNVDYGIRPDDPLSELIHTFKFEEDYVLQYQVNPVTKYIGLFRVARRKKSEILAPDAIRSRIGKHYRGRTR